MVCCLVIPFYFDSLISPCAIGSFTTFPCFPPCLSPPPWFSLGSFPDCSHLCSTALLHKESSSPLVCVRSSQLFRNLCQMCVFYCPMPDQIPFIYFFLLTKKTLSVDLYWERNSLFAVTWSVPAILGPSTNTKQWQQQSKLYLFSSRGSQVWLASLSGNENITELNHCETLYYI